MLAQTLNLPFVLQEIQQTLRAVRDPGGVRRGGESLAGVESSELEELESILRKAESDIASPGASQYSSFELAGAPPLDDTAFFSSSREVSFVQSAMEMAWHRANDSEEGGRRGMLFDTLQIGRDDENQSFVPVTRQALAGYAERVIDGRRFLDKFKENQDPGWALCALAMVRRWWKKRRPFEDKPAARVDLSDDARLILVGDWGTGLHRARMVAKHMRRELENARKEGREVHVIHLGDVYYSGWPYEYTDRFLGDGLWPVKSSGEAGSWSLNGNHDMYCGGHGYFDTLLHDDRFARQEKSSFFHLRHRHWDIFGLDTAYTDAEFHGNQVAWARGVIQEDKNTRKAMLLTHHQPVSAYDKPCTTVLEQARPLLDTGRVRSWFFGHEHRLVRYNDNCGVPQACCLGHGAVPCYQSRKDSDSIKAPAKWEFRGAYRKGLENWALCGFAVMDFGSDGSLRARYIDENGVEDSDRTEILV